MPSIEDLDCWQRFVKLFIHLINPFTFYNIKIMIHPQSKEREDYIQEEFVVKCLLDTVTLWMLPELEREDHLDNRKIG